MQAGALRSLTQRCKWKRREQQDSSRHPLPGTGVLNPQLPALGALAGASWQQTPILAEGPATLGGPEHQSGGCWASFGDAGDADALVGGGGLPLAESACCCNHSSLYPLLISLEKFVGELVF